MNSVPSIDGNEVRGDSISIKTSNQNLFQLDEPTKEFVEFAKLIQKYNWVHDIQRLKKVNYGLDDLKPKYFDTKPFFKVSFNETHLNTIYQINSRRKVVNEVCPDFDFNLFKSNEAIWVYFYRDILEDDWIEDGIIEQWKFRSDDEALKALKQMQKLGGRVLYFNTKPYFVSHKNYLFCFSTRAMAFSYKQKKVFEKFLTLINIEDE